MNLFEPFAEKALRGEALKHSECYEVLRAEEEDLLPLIHAAFRVRKAYFGRGIKLHRLINAKSGLCPEDCGYCSQSAVSTASIESYPLLSKEEILREAENAVAANALRFCIVTSGRGPSLREIDQIGDTVREIKEKFPLEICCSLGLLSLEHARSLKKAGVDRINHNINTSERYHPAICTTHGFSDRIQTLKNAKSAGLDICSGGIIGMGESEEDIIDFAMVFRDLDVDSIPINFLNPVPGTPMGGMGELTPWKCIKVLCLLRFLNPSREIRLGGGREINLRSLQPFALYVADSLFVEGYLTTPGQASDETQQMIQEMGFHVERGAPTSPKMVV